jgi:putative ABC transport system ATP-binding protein
MISIKNLSKSYLDGGTHHQILTELSLDIGQGQSISIQGASGSGKSTLLHLMAALDKPDKGRILIESEASHEGQPGSPLDIVTFTEKQADQYRQQDIGLIFQKYNLIDCITVQDNVYLPPNIKQSIDRVYIHGLMASMDILRHSHKLPHQLSGGEQQRVAIARALSHKPRVLLADEPTGNLDQGNSEQVSQLLVDTCASNQITLILVTHSEKVARLTQQQYRLDNGQLVAN